MLRHAACVVALAVFALPSMVGTAKAQSNLTWGEYVKDCGLKAQNVNQARTEKVFREKYKDKTITWSGKITRVSEALGGSGFTVGISMDPTESAVGSSDILLSASDSFKNAIVALNKGDTIRFTGTLTRQGGAILDHQVELTKLAK